MPSNLHAGAAGSLVAAHPEAAGDSEFAACAKDILCEAANSRRAGRTVALEVAEVHGHAEAVLPGWRVSCGYAMPQLGPV